MKIVPLSIMNFSGTPNRDKMISSIREINSLVSTFLRSLDSFHLVK